ncbi:MAG: methylmalonyl Co-A mutase-associated GTPase MeaB [Pseudomonadota bacterium]
MDAVPKTTDSPTAFERLLKGDVPALARAISILESGGPSADALSVRLRDHAGRARVIAFTGPPGAGKSTLVNAYVAELRQDNEPVAILAVDPSSPLSGGAVLGDRTRMGAHSIDKGVFIRSIAARNHLGGLSLSLPAILDAVDAAGWPTIILETVGAGQSETEIAEFADIKIVLNAPGLGDDVQAIKAGILEIADILVVNKSDLPLADRTVSQLQAMLDLRQGESREIPIVATSATELSGIKELADAVSELSERLAAEPFDVKQGRRLRGLLKRRTQRLFQERFDAIATEDMDTACREVRDGSLSVNDAVVRLLNLASRLP